MEEMFPAARLAVILVTMSCQGQLVVVDCNTIIIDNISIFNAYIKTRIRYKVK
jgi:hypothetical protein